MFSEWMDRSRTAISAVLEVNYTRDGAQDQIDELNLIISEACSNLRSD